MFEFIIDMYINGMGEAPVVEGAAAPLALSLLTIDLIIMFCALVFLFLFPETPDSLLKSA